MLLNLNIKEHLLTRERAGDRIQTCWAGIGDRILAYVILYAN